MSTDNDAPATPAEQAEFDQYRADTVGWWRGQQGDDYMARNEPPDWYVEARRVTYREILRGVLDFPPGGRMLEVGCGPGANLDAFHRQFPVLQLDAIEPNATARERAQLRCPPATIVEGDARRLPYSDGTFDLVLTCGVLIHVNPENGDLARAMAEIVRVTRPGGLILTAEYFAPRVEALSYRGAQKGVLWRADFGEGFLNVAAQLPEPVELKVLGYGFLWRLMTAFDDQTYFLLRKPA